MRRTKLRDTKTGSFHAAEHIEFVKNRRRNSAFKTAFERLASGKVVLDVGTGSGIMAIYAARAGAKKVIAIEKDETMARIAQSNFERNGLGDKTELIVGDALDIIDGIEADILVGELLSTWCVVEPQAVVFRHLLQMIKGSVETIPGRIHNLVQGVNAQFGDEEGLVVIPTAYFEFEKDEKAPGMTETVKALETTFSRDMDLDVRLSITLQAAGTGTINALRLTSITETCEAESFGSTDDTMPAMVVPLDKEIKVNKGEEIGLEIRFRYGAGWENFKVKNTDL